MDDKEWSILSAAFDDLNSKKLFVDDGGSININQLSSKSEKISTNSRK